MRKKIGKVPSVLTWGPYTFSGGKYAMYAWQIELCTLFSYFFFMRGFLFPYLFSWCFGARWINISPPFSTWIHHLLRLVINIINMHKWNMICNRKLKPCQSLIASKARPTQMSTIGLSVSQTMKNNVQYKNYKNIITEVK